MPRHVCGLLAGGGAPVLSRLVWPAGGMRAHGCRGRDQSYRTQLVRTTSWLSAGINKALGGGPEPHDDAHRGATSWAQGDMRWQGDDLHRLALAGLSWHDHEADGRERDGTAGMEKAEVTDFHKAIGQDMLKEPPEKLHDVEVGGAGACTAHFPVGEGDGTVLEAHDAAVGDRDLEDIGGR